MLGAEPARRAEGGRSAPPAPAAAPGPLRRAPRAPRGAASAAARPAPSPISSPGLGGALGREAAIVRRRRFPQLPAQGQAAAARPVRSAAARNALAHPGPGGSAETRTEGGRQRPPRQRSGGDDGGAGGGGGAAGRAGPGAPPPPSPQPGLRCHLEAWAQTQGGVPVARKLGPNPRWPSVPGQQAGLTEGSACTCSGRVGEARAAADRGRGWGLGRVATGTIGRGGRCWQAAGPSPTSHCLGEAAPAVLGMPLPAGGALGLGSASTCQIKSLHL